MMFLVARHGETNWNSSEKMQGWQDNDVLNELNEKGLEQAYELRENLSREKIDIIISSPLKRAKKTAEIIAKQRGIEVVFDDRLKDRNYGIFSGKGRSEFGYKDFWDYDQNIRYPNNSAECMRDFLKRVYSFIEESKVKYADKNILIITHNSVTRIFNCYFNGIPKNKIISGLGVNHGSFAKYFVRKKEEKELEEK